MKSIRFKIWLSFFLLMSASMLALSVFSYQSTKRQFLTYVNTETIKKLEFLKSAVVTDYSNKNSLASFKRKPARWQRLVDKTFRPYLISNTPKNKINTPPSKEVSTERLKKPTKQKLVGNVSRHQRQFMNRLILADENKVHLAGRKALEHTYIYTPILIDRKTIGYIGYIKPERFIRNIDQEFINKQVRLLSYVSLGLIILTILAALLISNWLAKPIVALRKSVQQLARGDYSTRVKAQSDDEVGALCYDINELAHTLDANERSRKQWVADISHEMRTPVAVIKAQIESLQDGIRSPSPENLSLLAQKVDSLSALINDLYELSLSDVGALNYNKTTFDFIAFYNQMELNFESHLDGHNIELIFTEAPQQKNHCYVKGDAQKLLQLFNNLLENAIRYSDQPGKIACQLSVDTQTQTLCFTIEDSPPHVPEDKLDKIFDRLFRMESSRNRATGGAGLGLSICKNIVAAHDGDIGASSSKLGGLKIHVTLPYASEK